MTDKYHDLFDLAPIGYFRLDGQDRILEVNLAGAALLGSDRSAAVRQRFGQYVAAHSQARFAEFVNDVLAADRKQTCEVELRGDGGPVYVILEGVPAQDGEANRSLRITAVDIRGSDEQGRIPYEAYTGFGQEFWTQENELILHRDQCACTRVMLRNPLPQDAPVMTPGGSFVCCRLSEFANRLSQKDTVQYRGLCLKTGFESLAIVPLRHQERTLGMIHLADETPDKPPSTSTLR